MKKLFAGIMTLVICLTSVSIFAEEYFMGDNVVGLYINEEWVVADQPPVIENDRTLAPVRVISEKLGFGVDWDETDKKVTITKDETIIVMHIGSKEISKNGVVTVYDVAPEIINDVTMVPVRAVSEMLSCDIGWHDLSRTVFVNSLQAYNYYNSLNYSVETYGSEYTTLYGHLGRYTVKPDYIISAMPLEKCYIIVDGRCNVAVDDGYGNTITYTDVKRIDISFTGAEDVSNFIGKRVAISGAMMGVAARANIGPFIFAADSIVEDKLDFGYNTNNYKQNYVSVLNTANDAINEVPGWAKLIDINNDGINEMLTLNWSDSYNYATLELYNVSKGGVVCSPLMNVKYSYSGNIYDGGVSILEKDSYIIIKNDVSMIGARSDGSVSESETSYFKISIDDNGFIQKELVEPNYAIGEFTNLLEITADYSTGTADMEMNEAFFDTREEVINQLNN